MLRFAYFFVFLTVAVPLRQVSSLSCYECTMPVKENPGPEDLLCLHSPEKLTDSLKTCLPHMKACKIVRVDHKETGRIHSFERGCSYPGEDIVEIKLKYIFYYSYCTTSKCNKGNGISTDSGQNRKISAILIADKDGGHQILPFHKSFLLVSSVFIIPLHKYFL